MGGILAKMAPKTIGQDDVQIGWTQVHFFFQCMTIETWREFQPYKKKVKSIWNSNEKDERAQEKRENLFFVKIKSTYSVRTVSVLSFIYVYHVWYDNTDFFCPLSKFNSDWCQCHKINSYFHEKWCNTFFVTFEMTKHC